MMKEKAKMDVDSLAQAIGEAVADFEEKVRGASYLASPQEQIDLLNYLGRPASMMDFKAFCVAFQSSRIFDPLARLEERQDALEECPEFSLEYRELGVVVDVKIAPHHLYGSRMTLRWRPLERPEKTADDGVWKWQDLNNVSKMVVGYAISTSEERRCFSRWKFLE